MKYHDGSVYYGPLRSGLKTNWKTGIMIYSNKDLYEGLWYNDKKDRKGTMNYSNGQIYTGGWIQDKRYSSNGTLSYGTTGSILILYSGRWTDDHPVTDGEITYPNGDIFNGQYIEEGQQKDGNGEMKYQNGDVFKGTFIDDKQRRGTLTFDDGREEQ